MPVRFYCISATLNNSVLLIQKKFSGSNYFYYLLGLSRIKIKYSKQKFPNFEWKNFNLKTNNTGYKALFYCCEHVKNELCTSVNVPQYQKILLSEKIV